MALNYATDTVGITKSHFSKIIQILTATLLM